MAEISIFIDDSGQLHENYYSKYFIYGGFWCKTDDVPSISRTYALEMKKIYHTLKEVKSSSMKHKHKRKVLRKLINTHPNSFNPSFVATDVSKLTLEFSNKQAVQLHKNYILRRFIEDVINDLKLRKIEDIDKIHVYIDNQNQTTLIGRDPFPVYLNKKFKAGNYLTQAYTESDIIFEVDFMESSAYRPIQIADLLANCKFNRYENICDDLQLVLDANSYITCRKHPIYFTSKPLATSN